MQVVLRKERDGDWVAIESAVRVLALLNEVRALRNTLSNDPLVRFSHPGSAVVEHIPRH